MENWNLYDFFTTVLKVLIESHFFSEKYHESDTLYFAMMMVDRVWPNILITDESTLHFKVFSQKRVVFPKHKFYGLNSKIFRYYIENTSYSWSPRSTNQLVHYIGKYFPHFICANSQLFNAKINFQNLCWKNDFQWKILRHFTFKKTAKF